MPFKWGPESERQMLFMIIGFVAPTPGTEVYRKVAEHLSEQFGGDLNANAVSQKFYKLKKEAEKLTNDNDDSAQASTSTPTKPATPRKRKAKGENDDDAGTPVKKGRKKAVKNENDEGTAIKKEIKDEDIDSGNDVHEEGSEDTA